MKIVNTSGKRKQAIAKATIRPGKGNITVNNVPLTQVLPHFIQLKIQEPVLLAPEVFSTVDAQIRVSGGGINGQAEAARIALCRGVVAYSGSDDLKQKFISYDRQLLVADVRRKEASKPNRHGMARSKVQKSYR
jgi:small subunit ribosomal protein S9